MGCDQEFICLFNGDKRKPPCFTPIRVTPGQVEAVCHSCGARYQFEAGRWRRVKEVPDGPQATR